MTATSLAFVYGEAGEPELVLCDAATDPPGQRWFTVVLSDSPGPDDGPTEAPVHVACLLDDYPELGRGFDLAVEHGGAEWVDGGWVAAPELWDEA